MAAGVDAVAAAWAAAYLDGNSGRDESADVALHGPDSGAGTGGEVAAGDEARCAGTKFFD